MRDAELRLNLDNLVKGLKPEGMSASTLAKIVTLVESAIAEAVADPEKTDIPAVALVGIEDGSIENLLKIGAWARAAAVAVMTAIQSGNYKGLPARSHKKLLELSKVVAEKDLTARFLGGGGLDAEISASRPVPQIRQKAVRSRTKIYGELESVGGESPGAAIRLFATNKQLKITVSEEIAKELGKKLYEFVGVSGMATVDLVSGEYLNFEADQIIPYRGRKADPLSAIDRIEEQFPGRWDGINPDDFVKSLRDGE